MSAPWVGPVLQFWFDETDPRQWWQKDPAFDAAVRARFGALHAELASGRVPLASDARMALAAVIVLDQFSRNIHRDDPRAFAADALARQVATLAVDRGWDLQFGRNERMFLALPFEHSEDRADQARAVALMRALGDEDWIRYALAHQALIERFGRFPHRNAVLGRESTPEELAALREPMSSF
jgi:uncharacterized protein (DUF924 family)